MIGQSFTKLSIEEDLYKKEEPMKISIILLVFTFLMSCTKKSSPELVLRDFVSKRFSQEFSEDDFREYLAGEILEEALAEEGKYLEKINEAKSFKMSKFKINTKRCIDDKCFLTYSLAYDAPYTVQKESGSVAVNIRKIAEMKKEEGVWKIFGITDVKTNFDYKE